jgi:hypothetical protein
MTEIELTVRPSTWKGHTHCTFLRDGENPRLEEAHFLPDGGRGMAYYWQPGQPVFIHFDELNRIERLAKGKRKPFVVKVQTQSAEAVAGRRIYASSTCTDWAREYVSRRQLEEMLQKKEAMQRQPEAADGGAG